MDNKILIMRTKRFPTILVLVSLAVCSVGFFSQTATAQEETGPLSKECHDCHRLESESYFLTLHSKNENCDTCHGNPSEHLQGSGNKKSTISNPGSLPIKKANEICLNCHESQQKDMEELFKAVPTLHDDLRCVECHAPHSKKTTDSDQDIFFKIDLSANCASCHKQSTQWLENSNHGDAGLQCVTCHQLHQAKTISQDIDDQIKKCLSCHPTQELEFKQSSTHPLREVQIKCSDCHNPHGGGHEDLLIKERDALCQDCHANIAIEGGRHPASKNTNHSLGSVRCLDCHNAHGSLFQKVLKHPQESLCQTCHTGRS